MIACWVLCWLDCFFCEVLFLFILTFIVLVLLICVLNGYWLCLMVCGLLLLFSFSVLDCLSFVVGDCWLYECIWWIVVVGNVFGLLLALVLRFVAGLLLVASWLVCLVRVVLYLRFCFAVDYLLCWYLVICLIWLLNDYKFAIITFWVVCLAILCLCWMLWLRWFVLSCWVVVFVNSVGLLLVYWLLGICYNCEFVVCCYFVGCFNVWF